MYSEGRNVGLGYSAPFPGKPRGLGLPQEGRAGLVHGYISEGQIKGQGIHPLLQASKKECPVWRSRQAPRQMRLSEQFSRKWGAYYMIAKQCLLSLTGIIRPIQLHSFG